MGTRAHAECQGVIFCRFGIHQSVESSAGVLDHPGADKLQELVPRQPSRFELARPKKSSQLGRPKLFERRRYLLARFVGIGRWHAWNLGRRNLGVNTKCRHI